jgi:tripartite-type tricarboxylate transporter receptor subunit TctC
MLTTMRLVLLVALAAPASAWAQAPSAGQSFPAKPIRFIAPFPAGGSSDLIARILSQRMQERLGHPVVVDNRPGASGSTGTEMCAKAPPDGYTIVLGSIAGFAINPHLLDTVGYDPVRDFAAVAAIAHAPQMLVVHPSLPAKTVEDFLELARKKPKALLCGSGGVGTPSHFGCELLRIKANAVLTHVPYKGTGQSVNDLLGAQIQAVFASMPVAYSHVKSGRLRALAVTSPERSTLAPELPTMIEAGVPGYVTESWWGVYAPARTPPPVLRKLGGVVDGIVLEPQSKERFAALGIEPLKMTPKELMEWVSSELANYGKIIKEVGIAKQ